MTAASSRTRIHSNISMAFPHGGALLPFNAFPGLTLGEHANGPQAHSVAIQGFEFEYRALEALAQGNSTGQIVIVEDIAIISVMQAGYGHAALLIIFGVALAYSAYKL